MQKAIIILILLASFIAAWLSYLAGRDSVSVEIETRIDTVTIFKEFYDTIYAAPEFKVIEVKEEREVDIDSLWNEALRFWQNKMSRNRSIAGVPEAATLYYLAEKDTVYDDSTLSAHISFISPIPLHPSSYFSSKFKVKENRIERTETVLSEPGWFERHFGLGISLNMGYDPVNKTFGPNISVGVQYRF